MILEDNENKPALKGILYAAFFQLFVERKSSVCLSILKIANSFPFKDSSSDHLISIYTDLSKMVNAYNLRKKEEAISILMNVKEGKLFSEIIDGIYLLLNSIDLSKEKLSRQEIERRLDFCFFLLVELEKMETQSMQRERWRDEAITHFYKVAGMEKELSASLEKIIGEHNSTAAIFLKMEVENGRVKIEEEFPWIDTKKYHF